MTGSTADGFFWKNGKDGCLLIHGLTSTPQEMEELGQFLFRRGYTISSPLLPGHHTSVEELEKTTWRDWFSAVETAYASLMRECDRVTIIGQSMGGTLGIRLVASHQEDSKKILRGLVLLAPALFYTNPLARVTPLLWPFRRFEEKDYSKSYPGRKSAHFDIADEKAIPPRLAYTSASVKALASAQSLIRRAKRDIRNLRLPLLVAHSKNDHTIRPESSSFVFDHAGTLPTMKELVIVERSGHVLSVDLDKESLFNKISLFLQRHHHVAADTTAGQESQ